MMKRFCSILILLLTISAFGQTGPTVNMKSYTNGFLAGITNLIVPGSLTVTKAQTNSYVTADRVAVFNSRKELTNALTSITEINQSVGLTNNIQQSLNTNIVNIATNALNILISSNGLLTQILTASNNVASTANANLLSASNSVTSTTAANLVIASNALRGKIMITSADTTPGFTSSKIIFSTGLVAVTNNPGANETLTITGVSAADINLNQFATNDTVISIKSSAVVTNLSHYGRFLSLGGTTSTNDITSASTNYGTASFIGGGVFSNANIRAYDSSGNIRMTVQDNGYSIIGTNLTTPWNQLINATGLVAATSFHATGKEQWRVEVTDQTSDNPTFEIITTNFNNPSFQVKAGNAVNPSGNLYTMLHADKNFAYFRDYTAAPYFNVFAGANRSYPAHAFYDDQNTGLVSVGADNMEIVTGGKTAIALDATQDTLFSGYLNATNAVRTNRFAGPTELSGYLQFSALSASTVPYLDANKRLVSSTVTPTILDSIVTKLNTNSGIGFTLTNRGALTVLGSAAGSGPSIQQFDSAGLGKFVVADNGNVNIGTNSAPSRTLGLYHPTLPTFSFSTPGAELWVFAAEPSIAGIYITATNPTPQIIYRYGPNSTDFFRVQSTTVNFTTNNSSPLFRVDASQINAANPSYSFYGDQDTGMRRTVADTLVFGTGGTDVMTMSPAQNVTINTGFLTVSSATRTNTFTGPTEFGNYIKAATNNSSFTITTTDFVINAYYTNVAQRSFVSATVTMTNILSADFSRVSLYIDQDGDGTFERTGIQASLGGVALAAGSEQLSAFVQPSGRFMFTNQSGGTATAAIRPTSSEWVKQ